MEHEMWLAREQDGALVLFFREKPEKKVVNGIIKLTAG